MARDGELGYLCRTGIDRDEVETLIQQATKRTADVVTRSIDHRLIESTVNAEGAELFGLVQRIVPDSWAAEIFLQSMIKSLDESSSR